MFHVPARPSHVWFVAVALSVHLGVYCFVHKVLLFERDPVPVVTKEKKEKTKTR
jgi:hypothetical protein